MVPDFWGKPLLEKVWPFLDPWDSVRQRTASTHWNVPGKYGPHGELFFFFIKKKPEVVLSEVLPDPFVSAETLKSCALIGLHLLAAENEAGSCSGQFPDLGDMWKFGCSALAGIATLSHGQKAKALHLLSSEHDVESFALNVMEQDLSGEKISLFLENCELGRVALSCHIALDLMYQEMHEAW